MRKICIKLAIVLLTLSSSVHALESAQVEEGPETGLIFALSASTLWLPQDKMPLSYTPLELGYAFSNGLQLRMGVDIFYFESEDEVASDEVTSTLTNVADYKFSYEMVSWHFLAMYQIPLPLRIRPSFGLGLQQTGGKALQIYTGSGVQEATVEVPAFAYLGMPFHVGLDLVMTKKLTLSLWGRYLITFSDLPAVPEAGLSFVYIM